MAHIVTWILIVIIIFAFIFFIASAIILEFGTKTNKNGNLVIPWYYWIFFVGSGILFLTFVILLIVDTKQRPKNNAPESSFIPPRSDIDPGTGSFLANDPYSHLSPDTGSFARNNPYSRLSPVDLSKLGRSSSSRSFLG